MLGNKDSLVMCHRLLLDFSATMNIVPFGIPSNSGNFPSLRNDDFLRFLNCILRTCDIGIIMFCE